MADSPATSFPAQSSEDLVLPPIYCPLEPRSHPDRTLATTRALDWIKQLPLDLSPTSQLKLTHIDVGGVTAHLFPDATRAGLEVSAKFHLLGFVFDDLIEKLSETQFRDAVDHHNRILRLIDAPHAALSRDDPYSMAFVELAADLRTQASPNVWQRWVELNRMFVSGVLWACAYRHNGTVPTPDTVTLIRALDGGGGSFGTGLIELVNDFEVPQDQLDRDDVRTLTDITWTLLAWDNDIYSYPVETEQELETVNFVTTLTVHTDREPYDALAEAIRIRNRAMWRYLELRQRAWLTAETTLRRYLIGLDHLICGHLAWALNRPPRYDTTSGHVLPLILHENPTTRSEEANLTAPVDLPSVSWWWSDMP